MKKALLILGCILVLAGALSSQDYKGQLRVFGICIDQDGKPIEGVRVKLIFIESKNGFEIKSDKDGRWTGAWLRGGDWNLDFDKAGYQPVQVSVSLAQAIKQKEMEIVMNKIEGLAMTDDLKVLLEKANALFDQKDWPGALAAFQDLMTKFPDTYPIWKNVGNCYFALEQYDKAEVEYLKVLEKDPNNFDAMVLVGNTYVNRNQTDKAVEWYAKVPIDKIKDATVLFNIGANYYNLGKFDEALRVYIRAVEVQPDNVDVLYQLGLTYLNLQKNAEAVATFESYLKYDADSGRAGQVRSFLEYLRKK